jgi:hypothetical protein
VNSVEGLLIAVLRQCTMPASPEDCEACEAMDVYGDVVRRLWPASAGSDQCPWHQGQETGWRQAAQTVEQALS